MKTTYVYIHKGLTFYIALGTWIQMFLAGIWHAEVVSTPEAHIFFGLSLLLASLLALIAAFAGKLPQPVIKRTAVLFLLILAQPLLIETRRTGLPLVSALHPVNAAFIGFTAGRLVAMIGGGHKESVVAETAVAPAAGD